MRRSVFVVNICLMLEGKVVYVYDSIRLISQIWYIAFYRITFYARHEDKFPQKCLSLSNGIFSDVFVNQLFILLGRNVLRGCFSKVENCEDHFYRGIMEQAF